TRFSPGPADTHGHHTASAILAVEAFRAAADPKFHPEELTGDVTPWQAKRILWNRSSWSVKPGEKLDDFFKLDVGGYSPLLGASFGEIAADSRSMHKSQGFGIARARGPALEYFKVLAESTATKPAAAELLAGIDLSWKRQPGGSRLTALVTAAVRGFDPAAPHASLPALAQIDKALDEVKDAGWREQKRRELDALMVACAGLFVD